VGGTVKGWGCVIFGRILVAKIGISLAQLGIQQRYWPANIGIQPAIMANFNEFGWCTPNLTCPVADFHGSSLGQH
jgi:hypothetical protein